MLKDKTVSCWFPTQILSCCWKVASEERTNIDAHTHTHIYIYINMYIICIHIHTYIHIWVNYNISLTWIKVIWEWFPLITMIPVRSQWGRYNLPRHIYIYCEQNDPCSGVSIIAVPFSAMIAGSTATTHSAHPSPFFCFAILSQNVIGDQCINNMSIWTGCFV